MSSVSLQTVARPASRTRATTAGRSRRTRPRPPCLARLPPRPTTRSAFTPATCRCWQRDASSTVPRRLRRCPPTPIWFVSTARHRLISTSTPPSAITFPLQPSVTRWVPRRSCSMRPEPRRQQRSTSIGTTCRRRNSLSSRSRTTTPSMARLTCPKNKAWRASRCSCSKPAAPMGSPAVPSRRTRSPTRWARPTTPTGRSRFEAKASS